MFSTQDNSQLKDINTLFPQTTTNSNNKIENLTENINNNKIAYNNNKNGNKLFSQKF